MLLGRAGWPYPSILLFQPRTQALYLLFMIIENANFTSKIRMPLPSYLSSAIFFRPPPYFISSRQKMLLTSKNVRSLQHLQTAMFAKTIELHACKIRIDAF